MMLAMFLVFMLATVAAADQAVMSAGTTAAADQAVLPADTTAAADQTVMLAATTAAAAGPTATVKSCETIKNETERLKCYDAAAKETTPKPGGGQGGLGGFYMGSYGENINAGSALSQRFELEPATKQGTWLVQPYYPVFILPARYTNHTNDSPKSPTHPNNTSVDLQHTESEFQLSFKVKAWENVLGGNTDLWFAYTQQSQWQVYSPAISRPFRETNYQPEIFLMVPTNYDLLGLKMRFVQLSLMHQSNGRANPLSRSWNRVYANFGFERGSFVLFVRPWYRIPEKIEDDDNPDIHRYMGYGDITAGYGWHGHTFSLMGRYNTATQNGSLTGTWSFPITGRLTGFVKGFTGYGETLIDYNWRQTTIGVGIQLIRFM